jgi:uncharacterized protein YdhG (YjbR/CyaY superfamily)
MEKGAGSSAIDAYIAKFPADVQEKLKAVRRAIQKAAPKATEGMGYGMPAYKLNGPLVYFAGYKAHIGFYPVPSGLIAFEKELVGYKRSKGAVQFPLDKALPLALIAKIVRFRAQENAAKAAAKKKV